MTEEQLEDIFEYIEGEAGRALRSYEANQIRALLFDFFGKVE